MAKIKRKVEMTLPKLIEWAWENEVSDKAFYSNLDGGSVYFDKIQNLSIEHEIAINETFTVEIEEEIMKETEIPKLVSINRNNLNEVNINFNCSIRQFLYRSDYNYYILNDDDTMTLIWKDGAMVDD
ncbi:hypothetical protein [Staphylococcus hominis]|uniref:Phage PVL protein n=1 Tax=Staphylococcus hominis TaxID=1290 RepID=A0A8X8GT18_STAHO|nr:hypothetical protein [Staphylococcus hominis]MCM5673482.1 hypothetical protein [Staphylococcus hominis]